jgi:FtsP/CotA-like multicopper oxidase with cupredoxin domain
MGFKGVDRVLLVFAWGLFLSASASAAAGPQGSASSKVRAYYVAADEVDWDYAPSGVNKMMGMKFDGYSATFVENGPHRIGKVYRKAIYREYTDETFTKLKPRTPDQEYLGMLGPVLRAEVGDTLRVVFRNNATRPYSMHPHGVFYGKDSEGTGNYDDGSLPTEKSNNIVKPGETHTYNWEVPERAGPGPNDPSSIVWLYHSHVGELKDVESGLIGPIVITRRGMLGPDDRPKDVDKEFVTLFMIYDENNSWYLDQNIKMYISDQKGLNKLEFNPTDDQGNFSLIGSGFTAANFKATINGYMFANDPLMTMKKGDRVRWYVVTIGEGINLHTPHWHGNVVLADGKRTDVVVLMPAQMLTVDMVPDDPGTWLFHCHFSEHMDAGMVAMYKVEP